MKRITKDELRTIASSLMLTPSEEVLNQIMNDWDEISQQLELLNKLDLNNVEPMTHINEIAIEDFFREDVENTELVKITKSELLANAKISDDDYIITTKVVK